jgi:hypothetical protein
MAWGLRWLADLLPASERRLASDGDNEHVLPEIVHDQQTNTLALWLTVSIVVVLLAGGGGFWLGRATVPAHAPASAEDADDYSDAEPPAVPASATPASQSPSAAAQPHRHYSHANEPQGAAVIAAAKPASGMMFVHRMNSDVRSAPSYDSEVVKKEAKGAQVKLIAVSDKWSEIEDGALKGWMRSSVLKDTPPGEKRAKKSDDGN